jgi:2-hydroxychromene-2-carboxylate isomerase
MRMQTIDWYFDFISPFAYLQLHRMARIESLAHVRPVPVLLAALLDHHGQKGPAEIPAKRRGLYRHVQWLAEREGIPLRFPPAHPFNPMRALRLSVAVGNSPTAVERIFRHLWREGRSIDDGAQWHSLCTAVGVEPGVVDSPAVKATLRSNTERAVAAQVFGVPSFVIDGEVFWGFDATELVIDYLNDPERFRRGEQLRLRDLPVGARRPPP